jgi:hypothetical protein
MNKFKLGDEVIPINDYCHFGKGVVVEVVTGYSLDGFSLDGFSLIGVCHYKYNNAMHNCNGHCIDGKGWYYDIEELQLLYSIDTLILLI